MILPVEAQCRLREERGLVVFEACDGCGKLLGPTRFTRAGDSGVWCSRNCRDGAEAHAPGTCRHCHATLPAGKRRGTQYCDDACRKARERVSDAELSRTKLPINAAFCSVPVPGSYHPTMKPENGVIADKSGLLAMSKV